MQRGNLDDLLAFTADGRERSFTKAAAKFGDSQSAFSHTIRELEACLGVMKSKFKLDRYDFGLALALVLFAVIAFSLVLT
jgi:hypothetical protein